MNDPGLGMEEILFVDEVLILKSPDKSTGFTVMSITIDVPSSWHVAVHLSFDAVDLNPLIPRHPRDSSPVFNAWILFRSDQICDANREVLNRKQYQRDDKILTVRKCYP